MSGMMKRRKLLFGADTVLICGIPALGMMNESLLILYPITPSLRPSLYVRTFEPPKVGTIAAMRVPEAAKRYKTSIGEDVRGVSLFTKPIVAGPGDHVCRRSLGRVDVNIERKVVEYAGDRLRPPAIDGLFAMSTHLSNSFDNRPFGPTKLSQIWSSNRSLAATLIACTSSNKIVLVADLQGDRNRADAPEGGHRMHLPPPHAEQAINQMFFNQDRSRR